MAESEQTSAQLASALESGTNVRPRQLFSLIYDELRQRAVRLMRAERAERR